jgi:hypothetical protein
MTLVCDVCGYRGIDVRPGLVRWRDLAQPFASVDRCEDRTACRQRVEARGDKWPVIEEGERRPA